MIVCERVSVGYRNHDQPVVTGIDFTLEAGQWLAVIGPNGAGKSTLLKGLAGVLTVDGTLTVGDHRNPDATQRARSVAYVPQTPVLPVGLTTAEYVLLGRSAHLKWYQVESARDRVRAAEVLTELDLDRLADRPVNELSGGEVQRAALARALAQDASILVLDEPTSALDLAHQVAVLELIDKIRSNHDLTVVAAMHDLTLASRFVPRILLLDGGRQVAVGSVDDVLTAEILSAHYKTPVSVTRDANGGLLVSAERTNQTLLSK